MGGVYYRIYVDEDTKYSVIGTLGGGVLMLSKPFILQQEAGSLGS